MTDEGQTVATDHDKLNYILKSFDAIDPVLLEQIQYYHEVDPATGKKQDEGSDQESEEEEGQKLGA